MSDEIVIDNKKLDQIMQQISDRDFDRLIEKLPEGMDDVREFLIMRKALVKLFSDRDYYEAVKSAVRERLVKDFYPNPSPEALPGTTQKEAGRK